MAAVTERVRFSTKILIAPLRPAAVLAKTLATMDVLSQGRLEVGVGTGWQREEYEAAGVPWNRSGAERLTDTIAACKALWRDSPASFRSATVNFDDIWCEPKPCPARRHSHLGGRRAPCQQSWPVSSSTPTAGSRLPTAISKKWPMEWDG